MAYSIKSALCDVVLAYLEGGCWFSDGKFSVEFRNEDRALIKWIIENDYISEPIIMNAVHDGICEYGRTSFLAHVSLPTKISIDHAGSIRATGYAIRHGAITKEEVAQIKFDHDGTAEEYINESECLLDWAMEEFRKGPKK